MKNSIITLYKYMSLKHLEKSLENQRLYLSDGKDFNDPFEITTTIRSNKLCKKIDGLHILCLTSGFRNKLIWSHYTDSHKGVCLTVDVPRNLVYPICYTSRRVYDDSDIDTLIATSEFSKKKNLKYDFSNLNNNKKIAYLKDKKWSYEKEYRIVFDKSDESKLILDDGKWFFPVKIRNVYLGVNFEKNEKGIRERIITTCKDNGISVKQMILSADNYALRINN